MVTIRILHHFAPGHGWSFESPDLPGLTGGSEHYDAAHAEDAARFALQCVADEQNGATPAEVAFEHYVPAGLADAA